MENKETPFLPTDLLPPDSTECEADLFDDRLIPVRTWSRGSPYKEEYKIFHTPLDGDQMASTDADFETMENYWSKMANRADESGDGSEEEDCEGDNIDFPAGGMLDDDDIFSDEDLMDVGHGKLQAKGNDDGDDEYGDDFNNTDNYEDDFAESIPNITDAVAVSDQISLTPTPQQDSAMVKQANDHDDVYDDDYYDDEEASGPDCGDEDDDNEGQVPVYDVVATQIGSANVRCEMEEMSPEDQSTENPTNQKMDGSIMELMNQAAINSIQELAQDDINLSPDLVKEIMAEYNEMVALMESPRKQTSRSMKRAHASHKSMVPKSGEDTLAAMKSNNRSKETIRDGQSVSANEQRVRAPEASVAQVPVRRVKSVNSSSDLLTASNVKQPSYQQHRGPHSSDGEAQSNDEVSEDENGKSGDARPEPVTGRSPRDYFDLIGDVVDGDDDNDGDDEIQEDLNDDGGTPSDAGAFFGPSLGPMAGAPVHRRIPSKKNLMLKKKKADSKKKGIGGGGGNKPAGQQDKDKERNVVAEKHKVGAYRAYSDGTKF